MKYILVVVILTATLFLAGCGAGMTNEQIITETKKCEEAGLRPKPLYIGIGTEIGRIQCIPHNILRDRSSNYLKERN